MLDLDTLRPDHIGCYGYHRNTTPNLDKIAKDGVIFNNYFCSDAPCLPSRAALMTGKFGIHNGVVNHGGGAADLRIEPKKRSFTDLLSSNNLPFMFRNNGFHTVTISPFAERHSAWWFNAGFNEVYNTGKCGGETSDEVMPIVFDWIDKNASSDNWFLHINLWDAHTPYRTPLDFPNPFENEEIPKWLNEDVLNSHLKTAIGPHGALEINMYNSDPNPNLPRHMPKVTNMDELKKFFDGYDIGINYMDSYIGRLIDMLKQKGIYDDMAIIVTSDHGEMMGELGLYAEHGMADYNTTRIPMIFKWPDAQKGTVDNSFHYNLDLMPTMAELMGIELDYNYDGKSYAKSITDAAKTGHDYLVISQCAHVCQRAVLFDDYIYIRTYHDGYHLVPKEMLFNIKEDPHEQFNLADKNPDLCMKGAYYLLNWHDDMMMTMNFDVDPLWTVIKEGGPFHAKGQLENYCKRLEETGRGFAVDELKKRHPREFTGELKY